MDVTIFFLESRDGTASREVNQKHSDNWKETKRKRKETEDHKSKRRKQIEGIETEIKSRVSRSLISPLSGEKQVETGEATHLGKKKTQRPDVMTENTEDSSEPNALSGNYISCLILVLFALREFIYDVCQLSIVMQKSYLVLMFYWVGSTLLHGELIKTRYFFL